MPLIESNIGETYTASLTLDEDADLVLGEYEVYVSLIHDWGNLVVDSQRATRVSTGIYSYTFSTTDCSSSGLHRIKWEYTIDSVDYVKNTYVNIVQQYIDSTTFFENHPEYEEEFYDSFNDIEKKVRGIIDSYCGQEFQFYGGKTLTFDGNGKSTLLMPVRLDAIIEVLIDTDDDITTLVEVMPNTDWYLRYIKQGGSTVGITRTVFTEDATVTVNGDWGWPFVPSNITEAADMLIEDFISHDRENFRYGITRVWMDTQRFDFDPQIFSSTGNIDADMLLMDYVIFTPELI